MIYLRELIQDAAANLSPQDKGSLSDASESIIYMKHLDRIVLTHLCVTERAVGLVVKDELVFGERIGRFRAFLGDLVKIWRKEMTPDTLVSYEI